MLLGPVPLFARPAFLAPPLLNVPIYLILGLYVIIISEISLMLTEPCRGHDTWHLHGRWQDGRRDG